MARATRAFRAFGTPEIHRSQVGIRIPGRIEAAAFSISQLHMLCFHDATHSACIGELRVRLREDRLQLLAQCAKRRLSFAYDRLQRAVQVYRPINNGPPHLESPLLNPMAVETISKMHVMRSGEDVCVAASKRRCVEGKYKIAMTRVDMHACVT